MFVTIIIVWSHWSKREKKRERLENFKHFFKYNKQSCLIRISKILKIVVEMEK